jgi:outer membrane protein TolC
MSRTDAQLNRLKTARAQLLDRGVVAEGLLPELPPLSADQQRRALQQLERLPEIGAKSLLARSELVRAREERAARGVHLSVGAQLRHDALGATIVEGTLSLPLPLMDVGAREYASRSAEATRLEGEVSDLRVRARAALVLAFHEVEHTQEVLTLLDDGLLPAAEQAVALRTRELEAGEGTLLELIDARRTLFDARARRVGALRERTWARIRVRLLAHAATGTP